MAVPSLITDLSTTPASNSPAGSENVFPNLDEYLRVQAAFLASIRDNSGNGWVSPYLTTAALAAPGPIGSTTPAAGTFTNLTVNETLSGTGVSTYLAAPPAIGGTTPAAISGTTGTFSGNVQMASANGSCLAGLRNRLINGGFSVNQRAVSGTVTLSAGVYGHDRWKAGASGCTYTFATSANVTTLTISAGSLIQVIEGINLESGTYCLSWSGTATAKIGSGSLSASGVTGSITGGTNTNIEISTGTVSKVQLELSPIPTTFESTRPYGMELALCQRYLPAFRSSSVLDFLPGTGLVNVAGAVVTMTMPLPVTPRTSPTGISISASADFTVNTISGGGPASSLTFSNGSTNAVRLLANSSGMTGGQAAQIYFNSASAYLLFTGCEL